ISDNFFQFDLAGLPSNTSVKIPTSYPVVYPSIDVKGAGGTSNRIIVFQENLILNGDFRIRQNNSVRLNDGANGDIEVNGNLDMSSSASLTLSRLEFPTSGVSRVFTVHGDIVTNSGDNDGIIVLNTSPSSLKHIFRIGGNIELQSGFVMDFYSGNAITDNQVILELIDENSASFTSGGGSIPDLYQIVLNKGLDTSYSFTFDSDFTLPEPSDIGEQPIEIINGLLVLDHADIDITLADGTQGSFYLPNTYNEEASPGSGGLEIKHGTVSVSGDDTGIILDGLLRISGGTLDMSVTGDNGNNFIEYGSSDNAIFEVTDGSLLVGSQVRRKLTAVTGLLSYSQSGGIARFGLEAAPESTRGVFEVRNEGSEFTLTGGEFTIVRENGSSTVGSLIIKPNSNDVDVSGSTITIGSADTPANQDDIGIDSNVALSSILITGNNNPTVKIYNTNLEANSLVIETGGTLDANGYGFTVNGDFDNDGTFVSGGTDVNQQTTYFPSNSAQEILGTGISDFFNLEKEGSGVLTVSKDITVNNDLSLLDGTMSTGTSAIYLEGDMVHDGIHTSNSAGPGIVFSGSEGQNLNTTVDTGEFGVLTIDNSNGVEISGDGKTFQINDKIILSSGKFNIGGNLLIMNEDATFENGAGGTSRSDFNTNSMVTVNASITDNGVRKKYNDSFSGTYLYPIGLNYYTPAEINITSVTGGDAGEITIKPIEDIAGGIPDDDDETCFGDNSDYVDLDNILQFYWLIRSENITDFDGSIFLYHVDALEAVDNTQGLGLSNYAPARLLDNTSFWDKNYSASLFDEASNVSRFQASAVADYANLTSSDLSGTYTAGITRNDSDVALCGGAIPDVVPEYITQVTGSGDVDDALSFATLPGGTAPSLGESPDLR
ncbi:MAG: hypothetical protein RJQ14_13220, partial [Marinoscillum sp.]